MAVANDLSVAGLGAADALLAELVVLLRLVSLEAERAAWLARRIHSRGSGLEELLLIIIADVMLLVLALVLRGEASDASSAQ